MLTGRNVLLCLLIEEKHPLSILSSLYLKLSENSGDVGLISQIGEDFQLKNTKLQNKEKPMLISCSLYSLNALLIDSREQNRK